MPQIQSTGTVVTEDSLKLLHTNSHRNVIHFYCIGVHRVLPLNTSYARVWPSTSRCLKFAVGRRKVTSILDQMCCMCMMYIVHSRVYRVRVIYIDVLVGVAQSCS